MREITIVCDGGLGNRLGALIGGLYVASETSAEPIICWPINNRCGCSYQDLFEQNIRLIEMPLTRLFASRMKSVFMIHVNHTKLKLPRQLKIDKSSIEELKKNEINIVYYNNIIPNFVPSNFITDTLNNLVIKKDIEEEVLSFCRNNKIDKATIGLHIRKTDFQKTVDEDQLFKVVSSSDENYFICSDDKTTEDRFACLANVVKRCKRYYTEKLKEGGWNMQVEIEEGRVRPFNILRGKEASIEGFIDMLILSRTNILLKTASTFSQFARHFSNKPLGDNNATN